MAELNQPRTAISVNNVHKNFALPHERSRSVKSGFTSLIRGGRRKVEVQHALRDISFDIQEGEFFGIVGRNGSGKSTLLKILAGIYQPTKGSVDVHGKLVPFIELGVGFNPELTGRENVFLNGALLGFSPKQMQKMYQDIVRFAELEKFMDQKLKNYSSGMQVRLAFSVAIMAKAEILLIDEVLAVGDADFQRKCFDYFKSLKRDKRTVVFVSHDMAAVQQYCDRALLINKSELVEIGSPATIAAHYNQLFMDQERSVKDGSSAHPSGEERWGDHQAEWLKVTTDISGRKLTAPEFVTITATGKANEDIDFPIFGFSIKDDSFSQITGHNTVRKQIKVGPLKKGEQFTVSWRVPNIFNTGRYYVDCTIAHDQATMVSDRWPDATSFSVGRIDNNPYPIWVDAELTYNKK
ncbi:MAG TPA: ABC transporter ATP-binding protein [Candidatus Saccharimonadales bacterium]|nr:ABC transporter ATP-binding protein [Candidatus Saccharimonadales bacterium]